MTQTTDEQQANTQKEFAHQLQLTLTPKDVECRTNEMSAKSAVMKFGPDPVENPLGDEEKLSMDVINKLQSEASSEAVAGDDLFAKGKDSIMNLITDSINRLQSKISHKSHRDDELPKAGDEKVDLETQVATHSCKLEATVSRSDGMDGDVSKLHADFCDRSQQPNMDTMRVDDWKTFANEYLDKLKPDCMNSPARLSWRPQETRLFR